MEEGALVSVRADQAQDGAVGDRACHVECLGLVACPGVTVLVTELNEDVEGSDWADWAVRRMLCIPSSRPSTSVPSSVQLVGRATDPRGQS